VGDNAKARTLIYIHGIGNKPEESVLRCQWDQALMAFGLGERSRMAYWCQADRHGPPEAATCAQADAIGARSLRAAGFGAKTIERAVAVETPLTMVVNELTDDAAERAALKRLLADMDAPTAAEERNAKRAKKLRAAGFEDIDFFDPLTRLITSLFLKDVNDFFFSKDRRERMRTRLRERLEAGNGPFVVIAHSLGSVIAYSLLQELRGQFDIAQLVTIGSPLGLGEVRDQLRKINRLGKGPLPIPDGVRTWLNVFDHRDVVAQGEKLAPRYRGAVTIDDRILANADGPRDAHSATGYLRLPDVQRLVRDQVDLERFQRLAPFVLAADAVRDFEQAEKGERRPLLIEIADPLWAQNQLKARQDEDAGHDDGKGKRSATTKHEEMPDNRLEMAERLVKLLEKVTGLDQKNPKLGIQRLTRYVSVNLSETEAQRLAARDELERLGVVVPPLYRIWRNAKKVALLDHSIHQVQASPAHLSYQAMGDRIHWAVLDSGCTKHPHFNTYDTIAARWDCTKLSHEPIQDGQRAHGEAADSTDRFGHGTHVAGIIAGAYDFPKKENTPPRRISGIAPLTKLHIYKVLNDKGDGDDAWIIKALDHIASINDKAGGPRIAGVNLSLGGEFEQGVFGCGHTPVCEELRRLWQQGVVVVLAAGNEGFRRLISDEGEFSATMPCSIGDPANLEEAIAVGAVHKDKPHTFGVSHFSSRGPTADGRSKPDCVAPGEQILSCRHNPKEETTKVTMRDLYYKLDGTSMAAPMVSGVIACFLSLRREFIGQPDKVKRILLSNCTDLGRDRSMQGAGMPNLVKMLVQT
jgi:subtilisin family serine protease/pimeloyl-ACP methyl ester carboxylesterase